MKLRTRHGVAANAIPSSRPGRRLVAERLENRCMLAVLFEHGASDPVNVLVPTAADYADLGFDWLGAAEPFDDAAWVAVSGSPSGIGYDRGSGAYGSAIGFDVESAMFEKSATLFARAAFEVADLSQLSVVLLQLRYDDGFIAWINGQEVARANVAGAYPAWEATATAEYESPLAPVEFDVTAFSSALQTGTNVLAIRLFNDNAASDDALLQFTLIGESRIGPPLAIDDAAQTPESQAVTINVTANDRRGSAPIDPTTVGVVAAPANGTAQVLANGSIVYTPNQGHRGPDAFTYTVRDNTGTVSPTPQTLVASNSTVRAFVPVNDDLGTSWRGGNEPFNDAGWSIGSFGVGYDTNTAIDFNPFISMQIRTAMQNISTSVYLRSKFSVARPSDLTSLSLRMRYDDGFVAFINGVEVARGFAPSTLNHLSVATGIGNEDQNAIVFQTFNLTPFLHTLRAGVNVLAIHGLNQSLASSDLLMQPELLAHVRTGGQESNAATVRVNVQSVPIAPEAAADSYRVAFGQTLNVGNVAGPSTATQALIPQGANWRYYDANVPPALDADRENWKLLDFDHSTWPSGPAQLGYGDGDEATQLNCGVTTPTCSFNNVTTWYRHEFNVTADLARRARSIVVHLLRDDGAAVYLNGVEVVRDNLPGVLGDYSITPNTPASSVASSETAFYATTIDLRSGALAGLLRSGRNVIAVELHQASSSSSDISFDLKLDGLFDLDVGVLANDSDANGEPLSAVLVAPPANGSVQLSGNGTLVYQPNGSFFGVDTFTYRASDGVLTSPPTTVSIHVIPPSPQPGRESYAIGEDRTLTVPTGGGVLANDTSIGGTTLSALLMMPPANGVIALAADGSFVYVPRADFFGLDTFEYVAVAAGARSLPTTVAISVSPEHDPGAAVDDIYEVAAGATLRVGEAGVIRKINTGYNEASGTKIAHGATDPDWIIGPGGDGGSIGSSVRALRSGLLANYHPDSASAESAWITLPSWNQPGGTYNFDTTVVVPPGDAAFVRLENVRYSIDDRLLSVMINDTEVVYTPAGVGDLNPFYILGTLGGGAFQTGTNRIRVTVRNGGASGTNQMALRFEGTVVYDTKFIPSVLVNDQNVDNDPFTASIVQNVAHGQLVFQPNGAFVYTPNALFSGVDQFTYRVFDGTEFSPPATVRIVVSPPGKLPHDLNADGVVDAGDVAFLLVSFGRESGAKAFEGDVDGDGRISVRDAIAVRNAFTPAPVPAAAAAIAVRVNERAAVWAVGDLDSLRPQRRIRVAGGEATNLTAGIVDRVFAESAEAKSRQTRASR